MTGRLSTYVFRPFDDQGGKPLWQAQKQEGHGSGPNDCVALSRASLIRSPKYTKVSLRASIPPPGILSPNPLHPRHRCSHCWIIKKRTDRRVFLNSACSVGKKTCAHGSTVGPQNLITDKSRISRVGATCTQDARSRSADNSTDIHHSMRDGEDEGSSSGVPAETISMYWVQPANSTLRW